MDNEGKEIFRMVGCEVSQMTLQEVVKSMSLICENGDESAEFAHALDQYLCTQKTTCGIAVGGMALLIISKLTSLVLESAQRSIERHSDN